MEKTDTLTRILAVVGTVLAWFPILTPFVLSGLLLVEWGEFRFDYLMPAELFPFVLAGGLLLLWAAWRARLGWKLFAWVLGLAVLAVAGAQGLAVLTGLASGETEPAGWPLALVLALLAVYLLAVVVLAVAGIGLLRRLLQRPR